MFDPWGYEVWQLSGENPSDPTQPHYVLPILGEGAAPGNINEQRAYWVSADTIAWSAGGDPSVDYQLCHAPTGGMTLGAVGIEGGTCVDLDLGAPFPTDIDGFLHLAGMPTLRIPAGSLGLVPEILTGQIAVQATKGGARVDATGLQIPGALDDLYAYDGDLGVVWDGTSPTINLWAPTAKSVTLHVFDDADPATTSDPVPMTLDPGTGVWSIAGDTSWMDKYYLYEVEVYVHSTGQVEHNMVTDPYSMSLAMNSARTQIVDLGDPSLAPDEWAGTPKPPIANPEDITLYELHIRDFSANDSSVPEELVGTYKAFTLETSNGMNHLGDLAEAGLTHVHLLPAFDIATINEDKTQWQAPDPAVLETYPPDSDQQQAAVTATEDLDGFNWGYDPFHYTTPEGSYSTSPDGPTRIVEFREMVQSLNQTGLRVVMDVVYNHTNASGLDDKSVLDRIVPGYYHRLNDSGEVETSTCCANTATEHAMMEKLMVDSVVTWARDYKVDGFRFDLMGHHSLANMQAVRDALDALTVADDGVDGSAIYLYGEGWNFGEVADNARFIQATQLNLGGSGIGSFSDRLRDAARGGGPFDGGDDLARRQGFINGLFYDYNSYNSGAAGELDTLLLYQDQIRVGLAGNLADYEFIDRNGNLVTGSQVDYNGQPAGYTADPQENIIYVSAHDNQTLFDISQYKHPLGVATADRARAQNVGVDVTLLAQGVPFLHAGVELLRSKSLDRDSFNSGDWFNKLDFTYQDNNWGVGLPVAGKNQDNWYLMQPLLADPTLVPSPDDIAATAAHTHEMLAIRDSSDLFRLTTADEVESRVGFHNTGPSQLPGLIVMSISDTVGDDLDDEADAMWSLINSNDEAQTFAVGSLIGADVVLHPVQANSVDPIVRTAAFDDATGTFTVPARTTAVFVQLEPDTTPPEVVAELTPLKVNLRTGRFQVWYSCSDDRDPSPVASAELNGIPVEVGTKVFLITHPRRNDHRWVNGQLFVWGQEFALTVTCTDEAGNTTVEIVEPEFATAPPR
jgi:pullulanase-type alpha-1,6-glucosidase